MKQTKLEIGMLLYPGFMMLDLVGPMTVFAMHSNVHLLWKTLEPVNSLECY
jgi:putative intracellular protease/amidase